MFYSVRYGSNPYVQGYPRCLRGENANLPRYHIYKYRDYKMFPNLIPPTLKLITRER